MSDFEQLTLNETSTITKFCGKGVILNNLISVEKPCVFHAGETNQCSIMSFPQQWPKINKKTNLAAPRTLVLFCCGSPSTNERNLNTALCSCAGPSQSVQRGRGCIRYEAIALDIGTRLSAHVSGAPLLSPDYAEPQSERPQRESTAPEPGWRYRRQRYVQQYSTFVQMCD